MHTLKLPVAFIRDCIECECDVGRYKAGHLTASPDQLAELIDRAKSYSEGCADQAPSWLVRSAKVLLAAIDRQA